MTMIYFMRCRCRDCDHRWREGLPIPQALETFTSTLHKIRCPVCALGDIEHRLDGGIGVEAGVRTGKLAKWAETAVIVDGRMAMHAHRMGELDRAMRQHRAL